MTKRAGIRFSLIVVVGVTLFQSQITAIPQQSAGVAPISVNETGKFPRIAAEFERQHAIMLSICDLQPHHRHVLRQIVEKAARHVKIIILHNNQQQLIEACDLLRDLPVEIRTNVSFYELKLNTIWLRDFGPRWMQDAKGARALDFYYYGVRPYDDSFPERWALKTSSAITKIPWTLQGGNLLANGQGLAITTEKIYKENQITFPGQIAGGSQRENHQFLIRELKKLCNLDEIVVLEPLRFEPTEHVDMFATFVAADRILVAQIDSRYDQVNSKILDRNATRLASINLDGRPLQVERITIPPRRGQSWSTYANVILTDRVVLIPTMKTDPEELIRNAITVYQRLLPNHHVDTIDITSMKNLQGALHCMTLNLPAFAPLPDRIVDFADATITARTAARNKRTENVDTDIEFTIDEQLRRIFKSSTSDYLVDAYAVQIDGDIVSLLRVDDKQLIRVQTSGVCEADRYWIQRNTEKIRRYGAEVYRKAISAISS